MTRWSIFWWFILLLLTCIVWFLGYRIFFVIKDVIFTQTISTGNISYTGSHLTWWEKISHQKVPLLKNTDFRNESALTLNLFPKIKINRMPNNLKLLVTVGFNENFSKYYSARTNSDWYWFALRFFLGTLDNWWFFNVYRKTNWGVANDPPRWLTWWIVWSQIKNWYTWEIPLYKKVAIATPFEKVAIWYQYTYFDPLLYLNNNIGNELKIWAYLSSIKNVPGRKLMKIIDMSIEYEWLANDVILVQ